MQGRAVYTAGRLIRIAEGVIDMGLTVELEAERVVNPASDLLLYLMEYRASSGLHRIAGMLSENNAEFGRALCDLSRLTETPENGIHQVRLDRSLLEQHLEDVPSFHPGLPDYLTAWRALGAPDMSVTILCRKSADERRLVEHREFRTMILFELFNDGALRANDVRARTALFESLESLPLRPLTADGRIIIPKYEEKMGARTFRNEAYVTGLVPEKSAAAIDKLPSLLSHRLDRLIRDGNQVSPGAVVRNGVYIGEFNILHPYTVIDVGARLGNENCINAHSVVGSGTQLGDRNRIGAFCCIDGVASSAGGDIVAIGSDNLFGSYVHIGSGIKMGDGNCIGCNVHLIVPTKFKDCRAHSPTKGDYLTVDSLGEAFSGLFIARNTAQRLFNGVDVLPGEKVLFDNTPECVRRFEGDGTSLRC